MSEESFSTFRVRLGVAKSTNVEYIFRSPPPPQVRPDGFASIALDWERPFLGPLHAWSSAVQGKSGPLTLPTMIRVLCGWLAERLENGGRLQKPEPLQEGAAPLSFFTDAKAEDLDRWLP